MRTSTILSVLSAAFLLAFTLTPADARARPEKTSDTRQTLLENSIQVAVFRYLLKDSLKEPRPKADPYFLAVGRKDPSPDVVRRVALKLHPVQPYSQVRDVEEVWRRKPRGKNEKIGSLLAIERIQWMSDSEVQVTAAEAGYIIGDAEYGGNTVWRLRVVRQEASWQVKSKQVVSAAG